MTKSIKDTASRSRVVAVLVFATGISGSAAAQTSQASATVQTAPVASAAPPQVAARTITLEEAINIALRRAHSSL